MPTNNKVRVKSTDRRRARQLSRNLMNNISSTAMVMPSKRADPPRILAQGEQWHERRVGISLLQTTANTAVSFTLGQLVSALSGFAANVPFRVKRLKFWAIGATQQQVTLNQSELLRTVAENAPLTATDWASGTRNPYVDFLLPSSNLIIRAVGLTNLSSFASAVATNNSNSTSVNIQHICEAVVEFQF